MAQLTKTIPNAQLPRVVAAFKPQLSAGEAVDLENPTGVEIQKKLEDLWGGEFILSEVLRFEALQHNQTFNMINLDLE